MKLSLKGNTKIKMSSNELTYGVAMPIIGSLSDEDIIKLESGNHFVSYYNDFVFVTGYSLIIDTEFGLHNVTGMLEKAKKDLVSEIKKLCLPVDMTQHKEFIDLYHNLAYVSYKEI